MLSRKRNRESRTNQGHDCDKTVETGSFSSLGSCLARRDFSTVSRASRTPRSRSSVKRLKRLIGVSLASHCRSRLRLVRSIGCSVDRSSSVDIVARHTHVARTIARATSRSRHRAGLNRELPRELVLLVRPARFIAQFSV